MIKSKFKTFGFWLMAVFSAWMLFMLISAITQYFFNLIIIRISMNGTAETVLQFIVFSGGLLIFGSQLWRDANIINIDTQNKSISCCNIITRKNKVYAFADLDGYVIMYQRAQYKTFKVIYLVKDERFIEKITSFIYSNVDEMQPALNPLPFLGVQNSGIIKSIRILFNNKVLE